MPRAAEVKLDELKVVDATIEHSKVVEATAANLETPKLKYANIEAKTGKRKSTASDRGDQGGIESRGKVEDSGGRKGDMKQARTRSKKYGDQDEDQEEQQEDEDYSEGSDAQNEKEGEIEEAKRPIRSGTTEADAISEKRKNAKQRSVGESPTEQNQTGSQNNVKGKDALDEATATSMPNEAKTKKGKVKGKIKAKAKGQKTRKIKSKTAGNKELRSKESGSEELHQLRAKDTKKDKGAKKKQTKPSRKSPEASLEGSEPPGRKKCEKKPRAGCGRRADGPKRGKGRRDEAAKRRRRSRSRGRGNSRIRGRGGGERRGRRRGGRSRSYESDRSCRRSRSRRRGGRRRSRWRSRRRDRRIARGGRSLSCSASSYSRSRSSRSQTRGSPVRVSRSPVQARSSAHTSTLSAPAPPVVPVQVKVKRTPAQERSKSRSKSPPRSKSPKILPEGLPNVAAVFDLPPVVLSGPGSSPVVSRDGDGVDAGLSKSGTTPKSAALEEGSPERRAAGSAKTTPLFPSSKPPAGALERGKAIGDAPGEGQGDGLMGRISFMLPDRASQRRAQELQIQQSQRAVQEAALKAVQHATEEAVVREAEAKKKAAAQEVAEKQAAAKAAAEREAVAEREAAKINVGEREAGEREVATKKDAAEKEATSAPSVGALAQLLRGSQLQGSSAVPGASLGDSSTPAALTATATPGVMPAILAAQDSQSQAGSSATGTTAALAAATKLQAAQTAQALQAGAAAGPGLAMELTAKLQAPGSQNMITLLERCPRLEEPALAALLRLPPGKAAIVVQELAAKAQELPNPSAFVMQASAVLMGDPAMGPAAASSVLSGGCAVPGGTVAGSLSPGSAGGCCPGVSGATVDLDDRAKEALNELPPQEAQLILSKVQARGAELRNPSAFVFKAAQTVLVEMGKGTGVGGLGCGTNPMGSSESTPFQAPIGPLGGLTDMGGMNKGGSMCIGGGGMSAMSGKGNSGATRGASDSSCMSAKGVMLGLDGQGGKGSSMGLDGMGGVVEGASGAASGMASLGSICAATGPMGTGGFMGCKGAGKDASADRSAPGPLMGLGSSGPMGGGACSSMTSGPGMGKGPGGTGYGGPGCFSCGKGSFNVSKGGKCAGMGKGTFEDVVTQLQQIPNLNDDAREAMLQLPPHEALGILDRLRLRQDSIRNVSSYLFKSATNAINGITPTKGGCFDKGGGVQKGGCYDKGGLMEKGCGLGKGGFPGKSGIFEKGGSGCVGGFRLGCGGCATCGGGCCGGNYGNCGCSGGVGGCCGGGFGGCSGCGACSSNFGMCGGGGCGACSDACSGGFDGCSGAFANSGSAGGCGGCGALPLGCGCAPPDKGNGKGW